MHCTLIILMILGLVGSDYPRLVIWIFIRIMNWCSKMTEAKLIITIILRLGVCPIVPTVGLFSYSSSHILSGDFVDAVRRFCGCCPEVLWMLSGGFVGAVRRFCRLIRFEKPGTVR